MSLDKLNKIIENEKNFFGKFEILKKKRTDLEKQISKIKNEFTKGKVKDEEYKQKLHDLLKGKKEHEAIGTYNKEIRDLLKKIKLSNSSILKLFEVKISKEKESLEKIETKDVKEFLKNLKKKEDDIVKEKYQLYKKSTYGQISNQLFKNLTIKLTKKYPEMFKDLYTNLRISNMGLFSDTYISMGFFSSFIFFFLVYFLLLVFMGFNSVFSIFQYLIISLMSSFALLAGFYYWPKIVIDGRKRDIKNDLPFAIMHMAAIAGSGAPLVNTFNMLLKSGEYKALSGEIKRIMNYVNLFGYNLSTALRSVAETTPSKSLKELLNGIRSTIESGGNLKIYLKNKAEDTFNTYKSERKKYVETLATYSDVYTAILIAAPLLFIIVLVLISLVGNKIGGLDIGFVEKLGIYVVVPAFNVAFIIFLNIMQPDM